MKTYSVVGALAAETLNLAIAIDLVVLEDSQLGLLALVLDLLGGGVDLLLPLLATTTQAEHQVEGRLLLDVVVAEGAAILKLLACENQTLLVGGNTERNRSVCVYPVNSKNGHTPPCLGSWP